MKRITALLIFSICSSDAPQPSSATVIMFPACMVVNTVLLNMTERSNNGILKMLALPVSTAGLCMAKFVVLLALAAVQLFMTAGMYFVSAGIATHTQGYSFILPLLRAGLQCL